MADGNVDIEVKLEGKSAESDAESTGKGIGKKVSEGVNSGLKDADKSVKSTSKDMKTSLDEVGSGAKSSFSNVGDAARSASSDASDAFRNIDADFDVSSQAQSDFSEVADAAKSSSSDAAESFDQIADSADSAFDEVSASAKASGDEVNGVFGTGIPASTAIAAGAVAAVTAGVVDLAKESVETGKQFDKGMSNVAATMGVSVDEVSELRDFAQEMGETTAFSASQAAEALNYMALAGYDAETSMRVLPTVLNLAAAGDMDLAAASDMVTDAQSALGLSVEDAEVMVDQMAKTSSKTNTSVEQLGNAFLTVGGTAKNLKGGTKELSQMLGILADNGIKGSEGGTALRNVILSLSAPTDSAAKAIDKLGLKVFDAEGNMRSMPDIMNDLNDSMSNLTQQEKTETLNTIFNKVDLKSVNALLGTSADRFDEVASAIDDAKGSAQQMADTQLDNLAGDVTLLESATEGFQIAVSDKLNGALRNLTQFGTNKVMPFLTNLVKNFDKVAPAVLGFVTAIIAMVAKTPLIKAMSNGFKNLQVSVAGSTTAFKAMTVSQKAAAIATKAMTVAMNALKSTAIVLAITALVEGVSLLVNHMKEAKERAENFDAATKGLESAATNAGTALKNEADGMDSLGNAIKKVDIDQLIEDHKSLADSINESRQAAETSVGELESYGDTLDNLIGKNLDDEGAADLQMAIDGINDALGTSYEISNKAGDGYQVYSDGVKVAKDSLLELIDTEEMKLRLDATSEQRKQTYAQLIKDQQAYTDATKNVIEAQKKLEEAEANNNNIVMEAGESWESYQGRLQGAAMEVEQARNNLEEANKTQAEAKELVDASQSADNRLTEQKKLLTMAQQESADALIEAAAANVEYQQGVQSTGTNLIDFTKALKDMGISSQQVADMSAEDAMKLAEGWKSGYDGMKSAADEVLGEIPQKLEDMGQEAYDKAYGTGQKTTDGYAEGEKSQKSKAVNEAKDTKNKATDALKDSGKAKKEGDKLTKEYGEGAKSKKGEAKKEAEEAKKQAVDATKGGEEQAKTSGQNLAQGFINGIGSLISKVASKAKEMTNAALGAIRKTGKESSPWKTTIQSGKYAAQGLAVGMEKSKKYVKKSASDLSKAIVDAADKRLSKLKRTKDVSIGYEVAYWKEIAKHTKKGSKARSEAVQKRKEATKKANDELLKAEKTFKSEVTKIQDNLAKDTKKAWDTYYNAVETRKNAILGSFNLFDRFRVKSQRSSEVLLENLRTQTEAAEEYKSAMDTLRSKIGEGALYQEIADAGIDALGQIRTINAMSDADLKEYMDLFNRRNEAAKQEAVRENQDLYNETVNTVKKLNDTANKDIQKAAKTLANTAAKLGTTTANSVKKMANSIAKSSKSIIDSVNASIKAIEKLNKKTTTKKSSTKKSSSKTKAVASTMSLEAVPYAYDSSGTATGIARTLNAGYMSQIEDSISKGVATLSLAAANGNTTNNSSYNQTVNFNQPISSPDEVARTMRMQQRYGLAGEY